MNYKLRIRDYKLRVSTIFKTSPSKRLKRLYMLCALPLFVFSCKEADSVAINSLQVFGEEFYYGETVNMGMAVETSDPDNTSYHWECEAGSFLQRQGYTLNQWVAPNASGVYKIRCTVTCGSAKQTREADLLVSGFFFEHFDNNDGSNSLPNGWAQSNSSTQTRNHRMELTVTTASADHGEIRYNMNKSDLYPPFSCLSNAGIVGSVANEYNPKYPNSDRTSSSSFASKFPNNDNFCAIGVTTNTPSTAIAPTHFISELRVEFYPEPDHVQPVLRYLPPGGVSGVAADSATIAKADFDAVLRFQGTRRANASEGISQQQVWYSVPFKTSALRYGVETPVTFGLAITDDYIVRITANGNEIFRTDAVKTWRATAGNAPIAAREFKYMYPSNTRVFLDEVYFYLSSDFK